ncbi:MAG TPA: hypothetical protein VFO41_18295 [Alphaproteobacteria bacterium]|nr:hypothetical protein [Alphaproteobacteria bacterium]
MPDHPTLDRRQLLLGLSAAASGVVAGWPASAWAVAPSVGAALPADVDPSRGTVVVAVCLPDGRRVTRAYSWSPTGYALVEDGVVIDHAGML